MPSVSILDCSVWKKVIILLHYAFCEHLRLLCVEESNHTSSLCLL
jgi:hypothetical protein